MPEKHFVSLLNGTCTCTYNEATLYEEIDKVYRDLASCEKLSGEEHIPGACAGDSRSHRGNVIVFFLF